jgi:hypothetical protein
MKETQNISPDQTELHAVKPVRKEKTLVGSLRLHKGQKVWELSLTDKTIVEAEYEKAVVDFGKVAKGQISPLHHQLIVRENCLYEVATNRKTADKKFQKRLGLQPVKLTAKNGTVKYVPAQVVQQAIQHLAKQHSHE